MTSALVNSAVLNSDITASFTTTRVQNTSPNQDFGKIMSQAKEKIQQTDENRNPIQEKETKKATETMKVVNEGVSNEINHEGNLTSEKSITDISQNEVNQDIDDESLEAVEEILMELTDRICEELDISLEELEEAMSLLGFAPVDLLNNDNLVELISSFTEDGNMIGLVADEELYQSLQSLIKITDELTQKLMDETGLTVEELGEALKKLEPVNENIEGIEWLQEESNIIDFPKISEETDLFDTKILDDTKTYEKNDVGGKSSSEVQGSSYEQNQMIASKTEGQNTEQRNDESEHKMSYDNSSEFSNSIQSLQEADNLEMTNVSEKEIPTADSIMKQLVDFVKVQNKPEQELTQMELQLHPASLGSVNVSLTTKGGIVTAQFATENETVKNAIETQVVQLRTELEEHGVKIDAIEVTVASHQMERNLEQNNQGQHDNENEYKADKIQKSRRININLNELEEDSEIDAIEEDDAARIAMEIMKSNGNTMDLMA